MKVCRSWILITVLILGAQGVKRSRRSFRQFDSMIRALTDLSLSDVNGYGNFCGFRGSGNPVDNFDRCCELHDSCLKRVNRKLCFPWFYLSFFVVPYIWEHLVSVRFNKVVCSGSNNKCQRALCECDKETAECFAVYQDEYSLDYKRKKRLYIF